MHNTTSSRGVVGRDVKALTFDNRSLRELPLDTSRDARQRTVLGAAFSLLPEEPVPLRAPRIVALSRDVMENLLEIAIPPDGGADAEGSELAQLLSGSLAWPGTQRAAHCYCGHQFGVFAGQLGDGAATYLGEVVNSRGERWEIQLKGAGKTPYSRTADGRKVLRSSIREFLMSEHMHALGIPTTRAGSIVGSKSTVIRDIFYDGRAAPERCAVVLRVAPTFLRFGSLETARPPDPLTQRAGPNFPDRPDVTRKVALYAMRNFFPSINGNGNEFLLEVTRRTARLVAKWQSVGWTHGVLNTDNMSLIGLTLDYGPFGFMERFAPGYVPNTSDDEGRYAFFNQPSMCLWNVLKLREALVAASGGEGEERMTVDLTVTQTTGEYKRAFESEYDVLMSRKFGLTTYDETLVHGAFNALGETAGDFTGFFYELYRFRREGRREFTREYFDARFVKRILFGRRELLKAKAAGTVPRAQLEMFQKVIASGSGAELERSTGLTAEDVATLARRCDEYDALSLSLVTEEAKTERDFKVWREWFTSYLTSSPSLHPGGLEAMRLANPRFVMRNSVAQRAIDAAERDDYSVVRRVLDLCMRPYVGERESEEEENARFEGWDLPDLENNDRVCSLSCSS